MRVALYARVSSQKQKEEETIESQLDALRNYAKEKGYFLDNRFIFLDNGVSGATLERTSLDELRDIIRFEAIDAVLILSPDRLSRNYTHQLILTEEFRKYGVNLIFLKNPPSNDTPEAKMFQHFQGIFAEYERALIVDRSRRGRYYKAKKGDQAVIPSLPYGYRKIKKDEEYTVEIVEEEASVVKEIFRLYLKESIPLSKVAKSITTSGKKPRKGGSKWEVATIRGILKNRTYTGTSFFGKTKMSEGVSDKIRKYGSKTYVKAKFARKERPEDEWIPISVPQIISESDFEQVQERLKQNKALSSRNTKTPSLLQGMITCGACGQPFYKRIKKNKDRHLGYYYCGSRASEKHEKCANKAIRQEEIDHLVFEEILKLLKTPQLIHDELERRAKEAGDGEELTQKEMILTKELFKLSCERDRLLDAYQSGIVELKELKERSQEIDVKKKKIEKDIKHLQALKLQREEGVSQLFETVLERMQKKANNLSFNDKRKLVRLLVEQVVVLEDTIKIIHCVSPMAIAQQECLLQVDGRYQPTVTEPRRGDRTVG